MQPVNRRLTDTSIARPQIHDLTASPGRRKNGQKTPWIMLRDRLGSGYGIDLSSWARRSHCPEHCSARQAASEASTESRIRGERFVDFEVEGFIG